MKKRTFSSDVFCILFLTALTFFYLSCIMHKPFWYDELFTWNIARLSPARIWQALGQGVDLNPPFIYFAVKASSSVFGDGNWGTRLPSSIAIWIVVLAIYGFVRSRASASTALGAALLPLLVGLYNFGAEARPYALMVASCALAFLCWQKAADAQEVVTVASPDIEYSMLNAVSNGDLPNNAPVSKPSLKWPILLALSLAMGISSHYYAIFIWLPLAFGEVVRSVQTRRVSWPVWLALAVGILPLFFYLPLIASSRPYMSGFWSKSVPREDIIQFYRAFIKPAMAPLVFTMLVFAAQRTVALFLTKKVVSTTSEDVAASNVSVAETAVEKERALSGEPKSREPKSRLHELAACLMLLMVPVFATYFALLTHRGYTLRYAIIGVVGCYLLVAFLVAWGERKWPWLGKVFALAVLISCLLGQRKNLAQVAQTSADGMALLPLLSQAPRLYPQALPIVVSSPLRLTVASKYGDASLKRRLVYLADNDLSMRFVGNDTNDRGMIALGRWSDVPVQDWKAFRATRRSFLLHDYNDTHWMKPQSLKKLGASTRLLKRQGAESLYLVTWPASGNAIVKSKQNGF